MVKYNSKPAKLDIQEDFCIIDFCTYGPPKLADMHIGQQRSIRFFKIVKQDD